MSWMKAIILAAGKARRLYPYSKDLPKCLFDIGGRTILDRQVAALNEYGVKEVIIVTGHHEDKIRKLFRGRAKFLYNRYFAPTTDIVSLWTARGEMDGEFVYLHSDVLFETSILGRLLDDQRAIVLSVEEKTCDEEDEKVKVDGGLVTSISKEVPLEETYGEFIGLAKYDTEPGGLFVRALEEVVAQGRVEEQCTAAIQHLIDDGHSVHISPVREGEMWMEIDFIEDLEEARRKF